MTRDLSADTRLLGVIGDPVGHSLSPAMHNAALEATGLDYVYVAFHVVPDLLVAAIQGMRALRLCGLNVTVPHKQAVIGLLDEVTEEARSIGAVNTIQQVDGTLRGHNTDGYGVLQALRQEGGLERLPGCVALLGAGGAARAILHALLQQQEVERVVLLNRTVARAEALAAALDHRNAVTVARLDAGSTAMIRPAGLLINATSVGMYPHADQSPLTDGRGLHDRMVVMDTVYNPSLTMLMQQARCAGARAVNGMGMLAYQGARSFQIWTGTWPPVDVMLQAVRSRLTAVHDRSNA